LASAIAYYWHDTHTWLDTRTWLGCRSKRILPAVAGGKSIGLQIVGGESVCVVVFVLFFFDWA
jgi:hypothetical protein